MEYTLVSFHEDGQKNCALLSSTWVHNGMAVWPKFKRSHFSRAIREHWTPPDGSLQFPVEIIGVYADYERGKRKEKKYSQSSDLESSEAPGSSRGRGKRRRIPKLFSPSLSPTPPKLPRRDAVQTPPYPTFQTTGPTVFASPTAVVSYGQPSHQPMVRQVPDFTSPVITGHLSHTLGPQYSQQSFLPRYLPVNHQENTNSVCLQLLDKVIHNQMAMQTEMQAIHQELRRQGERLNMLLTNTASGGTEGGPNYCFPLTTMQEFDEMELHLANSKSWKSISDYFRTFQAGSIQDLVRLQLKQSLGRSLRKQFIYTGLRGKRCFSATRLCALLQECAESNHVHQPVNRILIIETVKKWFYDAKDRTIRTKPDQTGAPSLKPMSTVDMDE